MSYQIYNEDCITGMNARMAPDSVDLCVTSIPFGALFQYSGRPEDIGNNQDGVDMEEGAFGLHMRFVCNGLFRVMKPGRNACIHIQQLRATVAEHGFSGRRDFRGAVIYLFRQAGFFYAGEVAITKNPQALAIRLKLHSLQFETGKRDSSKLSPAPNDFVLIFRKPGESDNPPRCLRDYTDNPDGWLTNDDWIKWASGAWTDINESDVLDFAAGRDQGDEKHICPLQLSVIYRFLSLYAAPGHLVFDPFAGIGSTAFVCARGRTEDGRLIDSRESIGFELKGSYHKLALRNLEKLERELEEEKRSDLFLSRGAVGV